MKYLRNILVVLLLTSILAFPACSKESGTETEVSSGINPDAKTVEEYIQGLEAPISETGLNELKSAVNRILSPIPLPKSLPGDYQVQRVVLSSYSGLLAKGIDVSQINIVISDSEVEGAIDPNGAFETIGPRSILLVLFYWKGYPVPSSYYYFTFTPASENNYLPEYLEMEGETGGTEQIGSSDVHVMTYEGMTRAEWRLPDRKEPQFVLWAMPGEQVSNEEFREVIASIELSGEELLPYDTGIYASDTLFPDPNLETYILDTFPDIEKPISPEDVKDIEEIHASGRNILSLSGLEHCTSLELLELEDNHISDLSPLSRLENLTEVNLTGNEISDVSPLEEVKNLKKLELGYNRIIDVEPLASITALEYLDLGWNQVDFSSAALSRLTGLTHLDLGVNKVPDVIAIGGGLKNLKYLYLNHNLIIGTLPLSGLSNLESLYLADNLIEDISPLSELSQLRSLGLYNNRIADIKPLVALKQLEHLDLRINQISDLTPFRGESFPELTRLDLRGNFISDASPLFEANMPKLEIITLQWNKLSEKEVAEIKEALTVSSR
ncbi:MAG: leucine-rich repeat domain-containing protein [Dehalococcoidia bacterium]